MIKALKIIIEKLTKLHIPYMIIGGIANSIYGNPRQTFDIDIKVQVDIESDLDEFIDRIREVANIRTNNPVDFILETNVLPVEVEKVNVDIVFAGIDYEFQAIRNAQLVNYAGIDIKVCSVEDLIIQKSISQRHKDWLDIETVIATNQHTIKWNYLLENVEMLSAALDNPDIYHRIKKLQK